jgi:hypothetical protein
VKKRSPQRRRYRLVCWPNEHFDKKTGQRVGSIGRHRLVLESIRPLQASDEQQDAGSVTAQQLVSVMKGKTLSYQGIWH